MAERLVGFLSKIEAKCLGCLIWIGAEDNEEDEEKQRARVGI